MLFTVFEIIFYFYYWYFTSSWNKISASYWKWDSNIPVGFTGPKQKQTLRLYHTNHTQGAQPLLGSCSCAARQDTAHGLCDLTIYHHVRFRALKAMYCSVAEMCCLQHIIHTTRLLCQCSQAPSGTYSEPNQVFMLPHPIAPRYCNIILISMLSYSKWALSIRLYSWKKLYMHLYSLQWLRYTEL